MQMQVGDVNEGLLTVSLTGRLDTPGVDQIESQLTAHLVPRGARAILDLSQVTFVASGGIRLFITIARALDRKAESWFFTVHNLSSRKSSKPHR